MILAAVILVFVGLVLGIAHLTARLGYPKIGLALVMLGGAYLVYSAAMTLIDCAAVPTVVPLTGELSGELYVRLACDGQGGFASYVYGFVAAPSGAVILALPAWRRWKMLPVFPSI